MKLYNLLFISIAVLLLSCAKEPKGNRLLNEAHLRSQIYTIDTKRDTTLLTKNGCIINIPKQSLEADGNIVKLEIKEAFTNTDIVLAGLTTMSGRQPLSSGGMIYINAADGYKVTVKKQLQILVPTKTYNKGMQVFTGEKNDNGKIDWKNPTALPKDETLDKIVNGEDLFKANCAQCHKIYEDFTGPALYGITDRKSKQWLYDFIRDPNRIMPQKESTGDTSKGPTPRDPFYDHCLMERWGKTRMPAYPNLTNAALDAILGYIKTASDIRSDLKNKFGNSCCDSCAMFRKAMYGLELKRQNLVADNEDFFDLERTIPVPNDTTTFKGTIDTTTTELYTKVSPTSVKATYYTINIQAMGWYNIDILMKDYSNCVPSELFVRIQGSYKVDLNIVLVIPSVKAFVEGGKLNDGEQYGFDEDNEKINLPQHAQCYVMAFAEYNNKIIFGKASFNAQLKQTIDLTLSETTSEAMRSQIKALNFDNVNLEIKQSKNSQDIKKVDQQMEDALKLKPKNCNCGMEEVQDDIFSQPLSLTKK